MKKNINVWLIFLLLLLSFILLVTILPTHNFIKFLQYELSDKDKLVLNFSFVNPQVTSISADPENKLLMRIEVKNSDGKPVQYANLDLSRDKNLGQIYPTNIRTDKLGECLVTYIPPTSTSLNFKSDNTNLTISTKIVKSNIKSELSLKLVHVPVIYIYGYQEAPWIFNNFKDYLEGKGFSGSIIKYDSEDGVINGSHVLETFLERQKLEYLSRGIQVKRFDLITHSMGGIVSRYYTCSKSYFKYNNINKIIFISVPHKGSPVASIGSKYFNDKSVNDLIPDSKLITDAMPNLFNKGLNTSIQVGSILGQYDEVVSPESASLEEWNIKTEVFNVGESNFNMENILNGKISESANHRIILNNKKIFEKVEEMLNSSLVYPSKKK